jgi:FkbM family methyltransferase
MVYAIEPNRGTYQILCENIRLNGLESRVKAFDVAVGDEPGQTQVFARGRFTGTSSLYHEWDSGNPRLAGLPISGANETRVVTLDSILKDAGQDVVDWLLIDAEGSEVRILKGAAEALQEVRNVVIECAKGESTQVCRRILEMAGLTIVESEEADPGTVYVYGARYGI